MKTMIIVETELERAAVLGIWEKLMATKATMVDPISANNITSAVFANRNGNIDSISNTKSTGNFYSIVYDLRPDGWHIYNFNTMEEEVVPEGDLAGLCNSKAGNFPFFN